MEIKTDFLQFKDSFVKQCCGADLVRYEPRGILNIEAFYWWSLVGYYKPDIILESGVFMGRSTEVLARAQEYFGIPMFFAFDKDPKNENYVKNKLQRYKKMNYIIKSSNRGFEDVLATNKDKKYLAILDGPKGEKPLSQLIEILAKYGHCCAIASHDCMPGSKIPPVLMAACGRLFPSARTIITTPTDNIKLVDLNNVLLDDMVKYYDKLLGKQSKQKIDELLNRSNYVGLCLN